MEDVDVVGFEGSKSVTLCGQKDAPRALLLFLSACVPFCMWKAPLLDGRGGALKVRTNL